MATNKGLAEAKPKKSRLGSNPLDIFKEIKEEGEHRPEKAKLENSIADKSIKLVPLDTISPDPSQPRKHIDPQSDSIRELAESIKKYGFINFITVREDRPGKYIIVAGERRYTAAKVADLTEIPVVVISKDKAPVDYALIQIEENLQREDLTAFEELKGYNRLQNEFGLQQKEIVELVHKSKSYISKMISLNKLSTKINEDIAHCKMEVARDILWDLAGCSEEDQEFIWKRIRSKPVRSALESAQKHLLNLQKNNEKSGETSTDYDAEIIWEALKKAVSRDKNVLFQLLTPKKVERLMKDFGSYCR